MTDSGTPQGDNPQGIDEIREAYERQKAKTAEKQAKLEKITFDALGLDPEKGIGKAFKMVYKGEIEPDELPNIASVLESEFDFKPVVPKSSEPPKTANEPVSEGERELRELANESSPAPIDPTADAIRAAEEAGDWAEAVRLTLAASGVSDDT